MRVLIADDQPAVRSALRLLLEQQPDTSIAGEVTDTDELAQWLKTGSVDVVLLDWELPGGPASELLPVLHHLCPNAMIVALNSRPQTRQRALAAGADDFVSKGDPPERLLAAVDCCRQHVRAAGNETVLSEAKPGVSRV